MSDEKTTTETEASETAPAFAAAPSVPSAPADTSPSAPSAAPSAPAKPNASEAVAAAVAAGDEDKDKDKGEGEGEGEGEEEAPKIDPTGRIVEPAPRKYHWGTGRRKTAVARVRLRPGTGEFLVNDKPMSEFFPRLADRNACTGPLKSLDVVKKVDVLVNVGGGGITGQAGAVRLGLGRALVGLYPDAHETLRHHGHLTRDPRMVERKKYGLRGARRAFQWVKR